MFWMSPLFQRQIELNTQFFLRIVGNPYSVTYTDPKRIVDSSLDHNATIFSIQCVHHSISDCSFYSPDGSWHPTGICLALISKILEPKSCMILYLTIDILDRIK